VSRSNRSEIRRSQSAISRIIRGSKFRGQQSQSSLPQRPTLRRVLDVDVHVGAAVEPGQVEQRALVDARAVGQAHACSSLGIARSAGQQVG
jgi:hypothetical protein